jgi:hypothetical protein
MPTWMTSSWRSGTQWGTTPDEVFRRAVHDGPGDRRHKMGQTAVDEKTRMEEIKVIGFRQQDSNGGTPGAKIRRQCKPIGWLVVYNAHSLDDAELNRAFEYCLTEEARKQARQCATRASAMAGDAGDCFLAVAAWIRAETESANKA